MNVAFFLTPKDEIAYIKSSSTMRQTFEIMEHYRFTSFPMIDEDGKYFGTITEGDLLFHWKNEPHLTFNDLNKIKVKDIVRIKYNKPVPITENIQSLVELAKSQNFVPVVDDNKTFIGIVKRSDIINYCYDQLLV